MSRKWLILAAVACGTFMATLDSSIVNIALPTLTKEFAVPEEAGIAISKAKWIVIGYLLTITCLILPFGRVADQFGRKRIFFTGFFFFTLASGLCGFSETLTALILARIFQGVGAAMVMANGPAVIAANFPPKERGKALGTLAMVVSVGLITGPSLGGLLIMEFGWRSIFLVNLPAGFLGLILIWRNIPPDHKWGKAPFDWAGMVLQALCLCLLIVVFDPPSVSLSGSTPFPLPRLIMALVTLALAAVFVKVESTAEAPLFDLSLLKIRTFWTAILASFLMFVVFSFVSMLMPFYLEEVLELPPSHAGYLMATIPILNFIVAPLSGRASDRIGSQELSTAGALLCSVALFLMAGAAGFGLSTRTSIFAIIGFLATAGIALGLFQSPNNNAIMGQVPQSKLSVASALLATMRNLGLVIGTGMSVEVFTWHREATGDFISSIRFAYVIAGCIGIVATVASLGKKRGPYWNSPEENEVKTG